MKASSGNRTQDLQFTRLVQYHYAKKAKITSAGNRTPATCLEGKHSTTELQMLGLRETNVVYSSLITEHKLPTNQPLLHINVFSTYIQV